MKTLIKKSIKYLKKCFYLYRGFGRRLITVTDIFSCCFSRHEIIANVKCLVLNKYFFEKGALAFV